MLPYPLDGITAEQLHQLCSDQYPESETLDFKRDAPGNDEKDRHEFLKDVCAFANTNGGDLIYGISEKKGYANEISSIPNEATDALERRLSQMLIAGIEPRIAGVRFKIVSQVNNGSVVIIRVPASYNGPHRVTANGRSRFVLRSGTHTSDMSYDQLRNAFDRTATLVERARQFRAARIDAIAAGLGVQKLIEGPICVALFIPISGLYGSHPIDIKTVHNDYTKFIFPDWSGASRSLNLDGVLIHNVVNIKDEGSIGYTQIFRSGAMEAVRHGGALSRPNEKSIPSSVVAHFFRNAHSQFVQLCRDQALTGPMVMSIALLRVDNFQLVMPSSMWPHDQAVADRPNLVLPEVVIDDIHEPNSLDNMVKPQLDMLWQSFGLERCWQYDENGVWKTQS
jgi:Putative DNA-binding domain